MLQRWIAGVVVLLVLYLFGLGRMGVYGPDEPRYASIGQEMARSGDYVTPRLWGQPWFEKPALLYWMVAAGFRVGLPTDLAPRVPVALLSAAFLIAFFGLVRREFGTAAGFYSAAILATSAGWLAYSQVAVTDVPMSAAFGLTVLFVLRWFRSDDRVWVSAAAFCLGLAFLAKSTPPLILIVPVFWFGRERWREFVRPLPILLFLLAAVPWYVLCGIRNGPVFWQTLFWQQQFQRFVSPSLQHVQHWWFYFLWLPALLFPWTPALGLLFRRGLYTDRRIRLLLAIVIWGFVFFSASTNKLPGYLLPLLPPVAILAGIALERSQRAARVVIVASAIACCAFPLLVGKLPALLSRNPETPAPGIPAALSVLVLLAIGGVLILRSSAAGVALVALLAATGYLWVKMESYPYMDAATTRPLFEQIRSAGAAVCLKTEVPREWRYGLNFYSERALPDCNNAPSAQTYVFFRDHRGQLGERAH